MNIRRIFILASMMLILVSPSVFAGDFDWFKDFNVTAQADQDGFRTRLAARFNIGDVQVRTVLGNVDCPADAYMILRLGEISGRPAGYVMERYRANKGQGWGALANSLGIKPGSKEFHALKNNQDLFNDRGSAPAKKKGKGKR